MGHYIIVLDVNKRSEKLHFVVRNLEFLTENDVHGNFDNISRVYMDWIQEGHLYDLIRRVQCTYRHGHEKKILQFFIFLFIMIKNGLLSFFLKAKLHYNIICLGIFV